MPNASDGSWANLVEPLYCPPTAYTAGLWFDARAFATVRFTCLTAGSVAYTLQRSPDNGTTIATPTGIDGNFNLATTTGLTAGGELNCAGYGWVRLNGGTGGTFMVSGGQ